MRWANTLITVSAHIQNFWTFLVSSSLSIAVHKYCGSVCTKIMLVVAHNIWQRAVEFNNPKINLLESLFMAINLLQHCSSNAGNFLLGRVAHREIAVSNNAKVIDLGMKSQLGKMCEVRFYGRLLNLVSSSRIHEKCTCRSWKLMWRISTLNIHNRMKRKRVHLEIACKCAYCWSRTVWNQIMPLMIEFKIGRASCRERV